MKAWRGAAKTGKVARSSAVASSVAARARRPARSRTPEKERLFCVGSQPLAFVFQTFGQVNRAFIGVLSAVEQRFDREAVQVGVEAFLDEPIRLLHAIDHGAVLAVGPLGGWTAWHLRQEPI